MSARLKLAFVIVGLVTACASTVTQKAAIATDVAAYVAELTVCRETAKDLVGYEACAKVADAKHGVKK